MATISKKPDFRPEIPIAPMIDAVFLLLIYFMVTSSLERQEADMSFQLPGIVEFSEPFELPDEQIIEINELGQVSVNDFNYDSPSSSSFDELAGMLMRYKQMNDAAKVDASVIIIPSSKSKQQSVIRVMDACVKVGIENVQFSSSDELI